MRNNFTTRIFFALILIGILILAVPLVISNHSIQEMPVMQETQDFAYGMNNRNDLGISLGSTADFTAKIAVLKIVGNETQIVVPEFTYTKPASFPLGPGYYIIQVTKVQANSTLTLSVEESGYPLINLYVGAPLTILGFILLIIQVVRSRKAGLPKNNPNSQTGNN